MSDSENKSDEYLKQLPAIIGIVLGFVLNYFGQWSLIGGRWENKYIFTIASFIIAISILLFALVRSFSLSHQPKYRNKVIALFIISVCFVVLAVIGTIVVEVAVHPMT